jgi:methyl-accepting chemotaxis protein
MKLSQHLMIFRWAQRCKGKALLFVIALLAIFAGSIVGITQFQLRTEVDAEMLANARGAMRVLAVTFGDAYKTAHISIHDDNVTDAVMDAMPTVADHDIVDKSAKMISGVVTIFETRGSDHVRVSTTVKTEAGVRAIGTKLAADHPGKALLDRGEPYYGPATLFGKAFITGYHPIKNATGQTIGILFVGLPMERANAMVGRLIGIVAAVAAGILLVLAIAGSFAVVRFVRPLLQLTAKIKELAAGNFDVVLPALDRKDEIGDMALATESFRGNLVRMRAMEAEQRQTELQAAAERQAAEEREMAGRRAAADRAETASKEAMHRVVNEFESTAGTIIDAVSSAAAALEATAGNLSTTSDTTQHLSMTVASASEQASANVQAVALATESMATSVKEISRQVQESSKITHDAVKQAEQTDARIGQLSKAATQIGNVVKLITAVAEQTNLLALNATIEAARAGEAGRGFAVVAHEVKALAAQTAKATDEISSQISEMQAATQESVKSIKEMSATIHRISEIASTIATAVEQQGTATQDIARNVSQAAKGTSTVTANIADVNRGASATGAASAQVLSSAQTLATESNRLKAEVGRLFNKVCTELADRRLQDESTYEGPERRGDRGSTKLARTG